MSVYVYTYISYIYLVMMRLFAFALSQCLNFYLLKTTLGSNLGKIVKEKRSNLS